MLASARQVGHDGDIAEALVALAHTHNELGARLQAAQLLGASEAVLERANARMHWSHRVDWERCVEAIRRWLTPTVFEVARAEGQRMNTEQVIALGAMQFDGTADATHGIKMPLQAAKARYGGLTAREREVAACVARGISNREIADELVLSERTVEAHIGNILGKLELSSRTQIATWALEKWLAARGATEKRDS